AFVDRAMGRAEGTASEAIQYVVTENVWGNIWNRPGLGWRDRSLLNVGMLVALRANAELAGHVRGGLTNGLTREEITEAVIHASGYCGAPAALSAMKTVQEVFDDLDAPIDQGRDRWCWTTVITATHSPDKRSPAMLST